MAKLVYFYGAMNSGKSTLLLQTKFNYAERNMKAVAFIPKVIKKESIVSRIGLQDKALVFDTGFDFYTFLEKLVKEDTIHCILIDEAQFLKKEEVWNLCRVVDNLDITVLCYGIRSDFQGNPFEGSQYLLTLADELVELKTVCDCGKNATMNMRKKNLSNNEKIVPILTGNQIEIGGNDKYISLCRKCYNNTINNE